MRQTSAESRKIDLMQKQAKRTPAPAAMWMSRVLSSSLGTSLQVLLATGLAASTAMAATPLQSHTDLHIATQRVRSVGAIEATRQTVLTAHVTDAAGRAISEDNGSATVSFDTGSASLGAASVDEDGNATLVVTSLPLSPDGSALSVHAVYHPAPDAAGATHAAGSVSSAVVLQPDATGVPDFTIVANPASLTVTAGQPVSTALTITPQNGFSEQVTLSCAGLPAQATCTFSPVIASTANGAFTSTLQIETETANTAIARPNLGVGRGSRVAFAWLLPGVLALAGFASLRRQALGASFSQIGLMLLLAAVGMGLSGCSTRYGYLHHPPSVAGGTPAGTYSVTVDASGNDGSAVTVHAIQLMLQVK